MNKDYTEQKFIICYNDEGIVHYTGISTGESISTGLPHYEEYDTEEEWKNRLESHFHIIFSEDQEDENAQTL